MIQFPFPCIAAGNVELGPAGPGNTIQGSVGCRVEKGSTGIIDVILSAPNNAIAMSRLMVVYGGGLGSNPSPGAVAYGLAQISQGRFSINAWRQDTVPPAAVDVPVMFAVFVLPLET